MSPKCICVQNSLKNIAVIRSPCETRQRLLHIFALSAVEILRLISATNGFNPIVSTDDADAGQTILKSIEEIRLQVALNVSASVTVTNVVSESHSQTWVSLFYIPCYI